MKTRFNITLTISAMLIGFAIILNGCKKDDEGSTANLTDSRDGQVYGTVKIGNQTWMAENLNYNAGSGSWAYDNNASNAETYGRLYNWETACEVCPDGWHLSSDAEWDEMINYLGGESIAGGEMKETGTSHWDSPNTGATNTSGFTALPGGYRHSSGSFHTIGIYGYWWSSSEYSGANAWHRNLHYDDDQVPQYNHNKTGGISVRCLKN